MSKRQLVTLEDSHIEEINLLKHTRNIKTDSKAVSYMVANYNQKVDSLNFYMGSLEKTRQELEDLKEAVKNHFDSEAKLKNLLND